MEEKPVALHAILNAWLATDYPLHNVYHAVLQTIEYCQEQVVYATLVKFYLKLTIKSE